VASSEFFDHREPLHPELAPLAFLVGTWRGDGAGEYPTLEPFAYLEELLFEHVGDPFLLYAQRSFARSDGAPLHFERGFVRLAGVDAVEVTVASPLGLAEVAHGRVQGSALELATDPGTVVRTHTGSAVTGVARHYRVEGDVMRYTLDMSMDATPMSLHLTGELRRVA
jgi:hypothetical protein